MSGVRTSRLHVEPFEDTALLRFERLAGLPGFAHVITAKPWNMSLRQGPQLDRVVARRRALCERLGLPFERLTTLNQVHSPHVVRIVESDVGAGRDDDRTALPQVDGAVCDLPLTPIMQFSADCPIVLVVDPVRRLLGTAHASWRGTVAHITRELVRQMVASFGCRPAELHAAIGPCAGPEDYEIGPEVVRIVEARLEGGKRFLVPRAARVCLDLRAANVAQLLEAGLAPDNIAVAAESTMTDDRFYSHRRDGATTGRFALVAGFLSA